MFVAKVRGILEETPSAAGAGAARCAMRVPCGAGFSFVWCRADEPLVARRLLQYAKGDELTVQGPAYTRLWTDSRGIEHAAICIDVRKMEDAT